MVPGTTRQSKTSVHTDALSVGGSTWSDHGERLPTRAKWFRIVGPEGEFLAIGPKGRRDDAKERATR